MATKRILTAVVHVLPACPASNVAMWRIVTVACVSKPSVVSLLAMTVCETAQRQTEIAAVIVSLAPWTSLVLVPMIVKVESAVRPSVGRRLAVMVFKMAMRPMWIVVAVALDVRLDWLASRLPTAKAASVPTLCAKPLAAVMA